MAEADKTRTPLPSRFNLEGSSGRTSRSSSNTSASSNIVGGTKVSQSSYTSVRPRTSSGGKAGAVNLTSGEISQDGGRLSVEGRPPLTSTPIRSEVDVNPLSVTVGFTANQQINSRSGSLNLRRTLNPSEIRVPVEGFEVMEQRARFTVFKLHVFIGNHDNWYVFRRYTDFYQLQQKLKVLFPVFQLNLPPKRWFKDNYERDFLEDRTLGLQAFIDTVTRNTDVCNSKPVQEFFCFDDPPGHHDSLEESRAYCESLEEALYNVRKEVRGKDGELELLREELDLYKSQVAMLSGALREKNASSGKSSNAVPSPSSSLAECDISNQPEVDQPHQEIKEASGIDSQSEPVLQKGTGIDSQSEPVLQKGTETGQSDLVKQAAGDSSQSEIKEKQSGNPLQRDAHGKNNNNRRLSKDKGSGAKSEKRKSGLLSSFS